MKYSDTADYSHLYDDHPFEARFPWKDEEFAEEVGAHLARLAVRTHVPRSRAAAPLVTLRMRHALRVLRAVRGRETISWLAERLLVGVAAASQLVQRMERRGLVERRRSTVDRRCVVVHVTDVGAAVELGGTGASGSRIDHALRTSFFHYRFGLLSGLRVVSAVDGGLDLVAWFRRYVFEKDLERRVLRRDARRAERLRSAELPLQAGAPAAAPP